MAPRGACDVCVCPACGADCSSFFIKIESFDIFRCGSCGHGYVYPAPPRATLDAAYSSCVSGAFNSNAFALLEAYLKSPSTVRAHYDKLIALVERYSGGRPREKCRVLDAGCSTGVFLKCLKDSGYGNVMGVELNKSAADEGAGRLGLNIVCSGIEEFGSDDKFDVITAFALIEHSIEPVNMIRKLSSMLSDDGVLIFVVPNFDGAARHLLGRRWLWYMPPYHLHHFTVKSMRAAFETAELNVTSIKTGNTGSNMYLLHYALFGGEKTEGVDISNPALFRVSDFFDKAGELLLAPINVPARAAGFGAHIFGAAVKK